REERPHAIIALPIAVELRHLHRWIGRKNIVRGQKMCGEIIRQFECPIEPTAAQEPKTLRRLLTMPDED
ncbi:MAG: hypothetical protein PVI85_03775, partial [Methyloceanibacter sp.]